MRRCRWLTSWPWFERFDVSDFRRVRAGQAVLQRMTLWAIPVFLIYAMRRVNCPQCGVVVERVPWASGKNQQTNSYRMFLATWAKRMSWQEVAAVFGTSWDSVFRAVRWVVEWGIAHQDLTNITSIGIDEIQYRRGHKYLTLVYQLDEGAKRLLYVARDRTEASLNGFFNVLSEPTINGIQFACTDMLPAYLKVLKARASQALNILDRFHIMKKLAKTLLKHESLLLNWFESKGLSSGIVEGFNNKAKLTMRKADGFKTFENIQIALFHQLGKLPEPESTHRFC